MCAQTATLSCIPNPESRDRQQKLAMNRIAQISKWISSFKAAGGKDVFAVIGGWNGQIELDELIVPLDGTTLTNWRRQFVHLTRSNGCRSRSRVRSWESLWSFRGPGRKKRTILWPIHGPNGPTPWTLAEAWQFVLPFQEIH